MSDRRTHTTALRDGWTFREVAAPHIPNSDTATWLPAEVPGHVHVDLQRNGVIADPFLRMHERGVQWVDEADWVYRCEFEAGAVEPGTRRYLRFEGLDTIATIRLDDVEIGRAENMFVPVELEVTDVLAPGTHVLEVEFAAAQRVGDERLVAAAEADEEIAALGPRSALMSRSMLRKAQYMYGWDWGPRLRSCGIWQDVHLVTVPVARITATRWSAAFDGGGRCVVHVAVDVDGVAPEASVRLRGHGIDVVSSAPVVDGVASFDLAVEDPQRWWPAGHGDQPLYDLTITVGDLDERSLRIGLREIELVREPDEFGESFFFRVNGVPIFVKGANWIPDHSLPSQATTARVRELVALARGCGMTMLRVWGGGVYESEDFYDACDELGILVWQDFPYACAYYPDDDATCAAARAEATLAVRRLRNHTSLALWCGNNENQWLYALGAYGPAPRLLGERLYDGVLPEVVAAEDPGRGYWPGSPTGSGTDPSGDDAGDCHDWNVWHGEGDWVHYQRCRARFVSEFGFSGPPARRTLEEALLPADLGVDTPAMRWHDKTNKGYGTYLDYIRLHHPDPETLDDLVYSGQLNQADAMRFGIEHFRRLRPRTMGTLTWQLNDCWPVQSWAWVDHRLRPKAVWYAARRFHAEVLLSLVVDGEGIAAHLVNDGTASRSGTVRLEAVDATGTAVWSQEADGTVDGGRSVEVLSTPWPEALAARRHELVLRGTFGQIETHLLLCEPKELRLPKPAFRARVTGEGPSFEVVVTSDVLAPATILALDGAEARWSDNLLDLHPDRAVALLVTPEAPMAASELASRLRARSLCSGGSSALSPLGPLGPVA